MSKMQQTSDNHHTGEFSEESINRKLTERKLINNNSPQFLKL